MNNFIIAGGAGYLGQEVVNLLQKKKKNVFIVDRVSGDFIGDINEQQFVNSIFKEFDNMEMRDLVLIYLIGNSVYTEFNKRTSEEIDQVMNSNIKAFILLIQEFSNFCLKNKIKGNVVAVSSIYGKFVPDFEIYEHLDRLSTEVYGASKAALDYLIKYFAKLFAKNGIRFNAIAPGGIYSNNVHGEEFLRAYGRRVAEMRMVCVKEVAKVIEFLSSEDSSGINGQIIRVDGGFGL